MLDNALHNDDVIIIPQTVKEYNHQHKNLPSSYNFIPSEEGGEGRGGEGRGGEGRGGEGRGGEGRGGEGRGGEVR